MIIMRQFSCRKQHKWISKLRKLLKQNKSKGGLEENIKMEKYKNSNNNLRNEMLKCLY